MDQEKKTAIDELISEENLNAEKTANIIKEYEFSGKLKTGDVGKLFTEKLILKEKKRKEEQLKEEILELIDKYTW